VASANLRYIALRPRLLALLAEEADISTALGRAARELYRALPHYTAVVFFRRERETMVPVAGHGADAAGQERMREGLAAVVAASTTPLLVPDVSGDRRVRGVHEGIVAEIVVPIVFDGRIAGAIDVQSERAGALSFGDRELLSWLAGQLAERVASSRRPEDG
jgi:putative methionine-R-sulfoxide reductase with GAF domain